MYLIRLDSTAVARLRTGAPVSGPDGGRSVPFTT